MTTCTCDTFSASTNSTVLTVNNTSTSSTAQQVGYFHSATNAMPYVIFAEGATTGILGKSYLQSGVGVYGQAVGTGGIGVRGEGGAIGVKGTATVANSSSIVADSYLAQGICFNAISSYVFPNQGGDYPDAGFFGHLHAAYATIYAGNTGDTGKAGIFEGTGGVTIYGPLSKSSGTFTIDHPLDPENKVLQHSFVESPDMKNVYDGIVTVYSDGSAEVKMPSYFTALNKDYRYQLTAIGGSAPNLHVSKKIENGSFFIAGAPASMEVSWQVTGIRQDAHALKNPVIVEKDKDDHQKGHFFDPVAHGFDHTRSVGTADRKHKNINGGK